VSLAKFFLENRKWKVFTGETEGESKSYKLLQGGGDPEICILLMSSRISLFKILSLPSPR
jgi:hypothetical protein